MATTTVRIGEKEHAQLSALAEQVGKNMVSLLTEGIELLQRKYYIARMNAGYARLQENPDGWNDFQQELRSLEGTLADGIGPK